MTPVAKWYAAAAAAAATAVFAMWPTGGPPGADRLNVLLISLDTLRADGLGLYGNPSATSPALDAFGASAVVFEKVIAPASWTLPSHMTMLTGRHPTAHGVHDQENALRPEIPLLAEMLADRGYRTFAMTGGGYVERRRFERGFDVFRTSREPFASVLETARRWIHGPASPSGEDARPERPWFAFLHTYDIHCPYSPPEPYRSMFVEGGGEPLDPPMLGSHEMALCQLYKHLDERQVRYMRGLYDGDVRWVDDALGPFLEELRTSGLRERTVIVVTSDHGEEFFEHGGTAHGRTLFREQLLVPLIVAAPEARPGRVGGLVGLEDIVPTILDLSGNPVPDGLDGRSLAPWVRGAPGAPPRDARVSTLRKHRQGESFELSSWFDETRHLIDDRGNDRRLLFDSAEDRKESKDLAAAEPATVSGLLARLRAFEERHSAGAAAPDRAQAPSEEERERLRSLGYAAD